MGKRILLLEPYASVAELLTDLLDELDYEVDVVTTGHLHDLDLTKGTYHCVFINLDQNRTDWRISGLHFAKAASDLGIPVVMIPDHEVAAEIIAANGWLKVQKPFNLKTLEGVIAEAVGEK